MVIITDEKIEYLRALEKHPLFLNRDAEHRVEHVTVNSKLPRTFKNPLFPSNYLDRELRKDQAAHRRETTCFGRNVANGLSRLACYLEWHNYKKRYLIKAPVQMVQTHGEMAGIGKAAITQVRGWLFKKRAFLSLVELDGVEERVWKKRFPTPGYDRPAYLPKYAFG